MNIHVGSTGVDSAQSYWCPTCGYEYQALVKTCPDCGSPIELRPQPQVIDAGVGSGSGLATGTTRWAWVLIVLRIASVVASILCVSLPIIWAQIIYDLYPPTSARFVESEPFPYMLAGLTLGVVGSGLAAFVVWLAPGLRGGSSGIAYRKQEVLWWELALVAILFVAGSVPLADPTLCLYIFIVCDRVGTGEMGRDTGRANRRRPVAAGVLHPGPCYLAAG